MGGGIDRAVRQTLGASFLAAFPPVAIERLLEEGRRFDIPAGTTLYQQEDQPQRAALVVTGLVRLYLTAPEGRQVTVRYARPSEVLGIAAAVGGPSPVNVQALIDCALLTIDLRTLRVLGQTEASVGWALAEELTERLYETLEVVAGSTFGTVRQRVARHLLELAAAGQEGRALVARVSQQELADATGSVREVVARVLRELRAAGLVETGTAAIAITDPAGLHREVWSRDPRSGVSRLASSPV